MISNTHNTILLIFFKIMGSIFEKLKNLFDNSKIEVCMVGLENVGKTTLLNQLSLGDASFTVPTVGLNVKSVKKGGVSMKVPPNINL
jgi:Arf/Sar family protein